jgi:hypothetical protein
MSTTSESQCTAKAYKHEGDKDTEVRCHLDAGHSGQHSTGTFSWEPGEEA